MPWLYDGYFKGAEAVKGYYNQKLENAKTLTRLVMEKWGDHPKVQGKTEAEMFGAGYVKGPDMHSPVIEVAEDMQSAKALWQFQAADTRVTSKGPLSVWKMFGQSPVRFRITLPPLRRTGTGKT